MFAAAGVFTMAPAAVQQAEVYAEFKGPKISFPL